MASQSTLSPQREHAFTMVELLVVLVITAILAGIAIMGLGSSRATGQTFNAVAVANAYASAADRFARDHNGRYPRAPGDATDWPNVRRGPSAPVLARERFYLSRVPESVQDGSVVLGASTTKPSVTYTQLGRGAGYEFIVSVPGRPACHIVGGTSTGASSLQTCSRR